MACDRQTDREIDTVIAYAMLPLHGMVKKQKQAASAV